MSRPVIIAGRHRPHEVLLLAVSLMLGVAYTIGAPPPQSLTALLPGWAVHVWAAGMGVSGLIGLVGVVFRAGWALQVEQAAMLIGAAAWAWYVAALLPFGWRALLAITICGGWMAANLWRAWQIRNDLRVTR